MDSDSKYNRQSGFSLVEFAMVLVIIGLIIGMLQVSGNLQRNANYSRLLAQFVLSWRESYNTFMDYATYPPGDTVTQTFKVNGADNDPICEQDLLDEMITVGVEIPYGRARGLEYLDLYRAPDGIQRQMEVCFLHLPDWYVGPDPGDTVPANVMRITGMSSDLARRMDAAIDGYGDAAWGDFRSVANFNDEVVTQWPDLYDINGDVVMVDVYFRMAQ